MLEIAVRTETRHRGSQDAFVFGGVTAPQVSSETNYKPESSAEPKVNSDQSERSKCIPALYFLLIMPEHQPDYLSA